MLLEELRIKRRNEIEEQKRKEELERKRLMKSGNRRSLIESYEGDDDHHEAKSNVD